MTVSGSTTSSIQDECDDDGVVGHPWSHCRASPVEQPGSRADSSHVRARSRPFANGNHHLPDLFAPWCSYNRHGPYLRGHTSLPIVQDLPLTCVQEAVRLIETRRRPKRPTASSSIKEVSDASSHTPDLRGTPSIVGMAEWLAQIGHSVSDHSTRGTAL